MRYTGDICEAGPTLSRGLESSNFQRRAVMPQTAYLWHKTQEVQARAQEKRRERLHLYDHASLGPLMPGANRLTRAITAAILDMHGLLDGQLAPRVRPTNGTTKRDATVLDRVPEQPCAAALYAQALTLCSEVESLCAQASALCREAESLCKARPAPAA
jgi:hypothetical protein